MNKLSTLLGLPILETETGMQIGEVQEVLLDIDQASIRGIILDSANWFIQIDGISYEDLFSIGRDAVMVRGAEVVKNLASVYSLNNIYKLTDMLNKQIFTETGFILGILVDIIFESTTGEIKAYQVSDSVVTDLLCGRLTMPLPQAQVIGQDKLIVPDSMSKLLHSELE